MLGKLTLIFQTRLDERLTTCITLHIGGISLRRNDVKKKLNQPSNNLKTEKISRVVVAVMTCLGALGLAALLYFPLHYL